MYNKINIESCKVWVGGGGGGGGGGWYEKMKVERRFFLVFVDVYSFIFELRMYIHWHVSQIRIVFLSKVDEKHKMCFEK